VPPEDAPPLDQLADDEDELDACDVDFAAEAVDELGELEAVLLGDTEPGTPEAAEKLAYYVALRDTEDRSDGPPSEGDARPDGP
jgi:hypothetical protein